MVEDRVCSPCLFGLCCLAMKLQEILSLCRKPGRYIGREKNAYHKPWDQVDVRSACIFPDLYEIGMSHLGLQILYDIINRTSWALADRAYCPDTDLETYLRSEGISLFGLESRRPLADFDCLFITLPYELCYSNIFTILDLAGMPLWSRDRQDGAWPLVVGGGSCCLNPEPVAELFDAIVIGDGEEAVIDILEILRREGTGPEARRNLLNVLDSRDGVYVPAFYNPPGTDNHSAGQAPIASVDERRKVRRVILPELQAGHFPKRPLVPNVQVVHDRLGVEISRGCTRGCRYCQASSIYRPVRERDVQEIMSLVENGLGATGWEEISLLSLSTGDYSAIEPLITAVMDTYVSMNISVSLPSLRVGTLTPGIMRQIKRVRKTGFTLAPEAGSDRLRQVINKGISEQDMLHTAAMLGEHGWSSVKLYFMIGLPTETDSDVEEIATLAKKVLARIVAHSNRRKAASVTVSVGIFVPKPHTPFQWERQISVEEAHRKIGVLKQRLKGRQFQVKWHDPVQSFLEGVFSRGDRRLAMLIHKAWQAGARLDAWSDHLDPGLYFQAADELGIDMDASLQAIPEGHRLPWDHIDSGITKAFLRLEKKRALKLEYTPDCRQGDCQHCGVCDFETIKPMRAAKTDSLPGEVRYHGEKHPEPPVVFCQVVFSKLHDARFLGHLDMVRMFLRAIRRARLPVTYSQGFHPMPKVSFSQSIPLGIESLCQQAVMVLEENIPAEDVLNALNRELPLDIKVDLCNIAWKKIKLGIPERESFLVLLRGRLESWAQQQVARFLGADSFVLEMTKKGREIRVDLKERVSGICTVSLDEIQDKRQSAWAVEVLSQVSTVENAFLMLEIAQDKAPYLKPLSVLSCIFGLEVGEETLLRILKTG